MPSSFCSRDPRDWHAHCAHSKVGAQCTGERASPILLASGSLCLILFWMLCTPRVRAGRGTQSTYLVKPCLLHDEAKGHCLVTYPGTLGSNLSRATVTSVLIKRNWIAGALPLRSLWWWTIKEKVELGGTQDFMMPENEPALTLYCLQTTATFFLYGYYQLLAVMYPRAACAANSPGSKVWNMSLLVPRAIWGHEREAGFKVIKAKSCTSPWLLVSTNHL